MRFVFLLILISYTLSAQIDCRSYVELDADSLSFQKVTDSVFYFKIRPDSSQRTIRFKGDFESLEINPTECNNGSGYLLNSNGLIMPTEQMINSGICYCNSCIERYSEFSLSSGLFVKVKGLTNLFPEILVKEEFVNKEWYEKELKSGDKIRLNNILFVGGKAEFRPISFKDLDRLYLVLTNNPKVEVEIQGHVNAPGKRNSKKNQTLSEDRAKAVVDYLIKKGINSSRLIAKGYGNTEMVYPKAKSEYEMQFNRRVEVVVK